MSEEQPYTRKDLTGTDFSGVDLSGKSLAHSTLTDCRFGNCEGVNFVCTHGERVNFTGVNISGATFEKADESVLRCLIGAVWNGAEITHVSGWITSSGLYWSFCTNAFVQIGCMQRTIEEWQAIGATRETLGVALGDRLSTEQLDATFEWWQVNSALLIEYSNNFARG